MRSATLVFITCSAIAGIATGATPPPPTKTVSSAKKGAPGVPTKAPAVHTAASTKTPVKTPAPSPVRTAANPAATRQTTARRSYVRQQPVRRYYTPQQNSPTPERYREIQDALAAKGYLKTPPNGVWDKDSIDAMQHFQQDQKLDPTGKLTARSLGALGLGPKTPPPPIEESPAPVSGETAPGGR